MPREPDVAAPAVVAATPRPSSSNKSDEGPLDVLPSVLRRDPHATLQLAISVTRIDEPPLRPAAVGAQLAVTASERSSDAAREAVPRARGRPYWRSSCCPPRAAGQSTSSRCHRAASPGGITAGPDGALWFVEEGTSAIGRMTTGRGGDQPLPGHEVGPDDPTAPVSALDQITPAPTARCGSPSRVTTRSAESPPRGHQ